VNQLSSCTGTSIKLNTILSTEKDGDQYIYQNFLANENPKNADKNAQKSYENLKAGINNVFSTGMNFLKQMRLFCALFLWLCKFARYCGKMYNRHLLKAVD